MKKTTAREFLGALAASGVESQAAAVEAAKACPEVAVATDGWQHVTRWHDKATRVNGGTISCRQTDAWLVGDPLPVVSRPSGGETRIIGLVRQTFLSEPVGPAGRFVIVTVEETVLDDEYEAFAAGRARPHVTVRVGFQCGTSQCGWCGHGSEEEPAGYPCEDCGGA